MSELELLYRSILAVVDALDDLRFSPRPVDEDWRRHKDTLDDERKHRDRSVAALKECMAVLDQVRTALPSDWLGSDPKASKYIQLKSALRTMLSWLSDFQRPFRGYKMPLLGDDPEQIRRWEEAQDTMLAVAKDLRDKVDLQAANASRAAPDQVPVERIRHLPISDQAKDIFISATKFVLDNPKRFEAAAARLGAEVYPAGPPPAGEVDRAAYTLHQVFRDYAMADAPALTGNDYDLWAHSILLLAALVSYPGDLSALGPAGAIPWQNGSETIPMTAPATRDEPVASRADEPEESDATEFPIPLPGRQWVLLDMEGKLRHEFQDQSDPNTPGILMQGLDKLRVVLAEVLPPAPPQNQNKNTDPAPSPLSTKPSFTVGAASALQLRQNTEQPPPVQPERGFTVAEVRELLGLGNTALSSYARRAGVPRPARGQRNFLYTLQSVKAIIEQILRASSETNLRQRCQQALDQITPDH